MIKLEKTDYSAFSLDLPISKRSLMYRTWNMKEHKRLIIAYESKEPLDFQQAIFQVASQIVVDGTNVSLLPAVEVDYLFLKARTKSIGEVVKISLMNHEEKKKKMVGVDLTKVKFPSTEKRNYKIPLLTKDGSESENFLMMKELSFGARLEIMSLKKRDPEVVEEIEMALACIDRVCNNAGDSIDPSSDPEMMRSLRESIEGMSPKQYEVIDEFLGTAPILKEEIDISTVFPGYTGVYLLSGSEDFFA